MSLFDQLGNEKNQQPQQMNMQQALQQLRSNPVSTLRQAGLNIPDGLTNPQQIVNHLIQSGQVPQSRLTQAMRFLQGGRR